MQVNLLNGSESQMNCRETSLCIRVRAFGNTKREEIKTKSDMKLSNFSFVDKNWYQNNFNIFQFFVPFLKVEMRVPKRFGGMR